MDEQDFVFLSKEAAKKRVDERAKMVEQFRQAQANQPKQPEGQPGEPKQSAEQPKKVKLPGK